MGYNFRDLNRNQMYLLPVSMDEWLPEDDLAWVIIEAVNQMDLMAFYAKYRKDGMGGKGYDPSVLLSLLLYSYCMGIRSSRKIEWLCGIAYRVITGNQFPDHCTISRFRKNNEVELENLFTEVLRICHAAGLVKVGIVALDGSKMPANASLSSNRTEEHIHEEVRKFLKEADKIDAEEDSLYGEDKRGDELPEELRKGTSRAKRLFECKERLEAELKESDEAERMREQERKEKELEALEKFKKVRGRKPKFLGKKEDKNGEKEKEEKEKKPCANVTDPDSRIMKTRKGFIQGYNAQAVVTEGQIIIAAEITQEANDQHQLHPMIEKAQDNLVKAGIEEKIDTVLADAGYCSESNLSKSGPDTPELIIAVKKDYKQRKDMKEESAPKGRIPSNLTHRERMERKLKTKRGKSLYKKRGQTVEPVFGQIKSGRGCDGFIVRGKPNCNSEWKIICSAHNLLKLWRKVKKDIENGINNIAGRMKLGLSVG